MAGPDFTLTSAVDAYIVSSDSFFNGNGGSTNNISSSSAPNQAGGYWTRYTLIAFDTLSIPVNARISKAMLVLQTTSLSYNPSAPTQPSYVTPKDRVQAYKITSSWDSNTVNWASQPSVTSTDSSESQVVGWTSNSYGQTGRLEFDVTPHCRSWVTDPSTNWGVLLSVLEIGNIAVYNVASAESSLAAVPSLQVYVSNEYGKVML